MIVGHYEFTVAPGATSCARDTVLPAAGQPRHRDYDSTPHKITVEITVGGDESIGNVLATLDYHLSKLGLEMRT